MHADYCGALKPAAPRPSHERPLDDDEDDDDWAPPVAVPRMPHTQRRTRASSVSGPPPVSVPESVLPWLSSLGLPPKVLPRPGLLWTEAAVLEDPLRNGGLLAELAARLSGKPVRGGAVAVVKTLEEARRRNREALGRLSRLVDREGRRGGAGWEGWEGWEGWAEVMVRGDEGAVWGVCEAARSALASREEGGRRRGGGAVEGLGYSRQGCESLAKALCR